ncbi:MAG TPA: glycosyltransferase family 4 protein, partial [Baekduia sp.]|nr:glycosyltransferase family 4 protein [Baekduia sp.]
MTSGGGAAAPIRVLFLSSHAQLGGGEAYMRSIVEGLDEGFAADVVSLHDGPFVERLREGGHEVTVLPAHGRAGILTGVRALRRRLREQRADVVHANGVKAALIAVLAALPSGPPVVWCKFDFAWDGWLADLVAQRCRLVVGISAAVNEALAPRHRERTRVVWAGIPDYPDRREHGAALVREWLGGAPDGPLIALSGRLCPGKGQLDLVEALPAVLEQHPRARAILLGVPDTFYPDFRGRLEQRAAELGVTDAVLFAPLEGHRPGEAVAVVSACDVLAQPSQLQERRLEGGL